MPVPRWSNIVALSVTGSRKRSMRRGAAPVAARAPRGRQGFVNARVLVVEDDAANRETLCALLEQMGHFPVAAPRGEDAIDVLDAGTVIDVIISDVVMPGISGIEFTRQARERRPNVPVVLVTGDSDAMESVLANGAVALLKPYSAATLERVIADALAARR